MLSRLEFQNFRVSRTLEATLQSTTHVFTSSLHDGQEMSLNTSTSSSLTIYFPHFNVASLNTQPAAMSKL